MNTIQQRAEKIAKSTENAYSFSAYGSRGWKASIVMLLRRGYSDAEAEAIMRSKWTRWAADASDNRFGRHSSADLARFLDSSGECSPANIAGLVAGTY